MRSILIRNLLIGAFVSGLAQAMMYDYITIKYYTKLQNKDLAITCK